MYHSLIVGEFIIEGFLHTYSNTGTDIPRYLRWAKRLRRSSAALS